MSIFAIISILSYTGLHSVILSKTETEAALNRLQQLQMTMLTLSNDMQQLVNRPGHDSMGSPLYPLTTQNSDYIVSFSRSGWRNPAQLPRSTIQRVAYRIDEDKLIRVYWPHIDRANDEKVVERVLIKNIDSLDLRFKNDKNEWKLDWPSASSLSSGSATSLPRAVEITLKMSDWGDIVRLIRVTR